LFEKERINEYTGVDGIRNKMMHDDDDEMALALALFP